MAAVTPLAIAAALLLGACGEKEEPDLSTVPEPVETTTVPTTTAPTQTTPQQQQQQDPQQP